LLAALHARFPRVRKFCSAPAGMKKTGPGRRSRRRRAPDCDPISLRLDVRIVISRCTNSLQKRISLVPNGNFSKAPNISLKCVRAPANFNAQQQREAV